MQSFNDIMKLILESLKDEVSETAISLWFDDASLAVLNDEYAVLLCKLDFKKEIIEKRYRSTIENKLESILGFRVKVYCVSCEKEPFHADAFAKSLDPLYQEDSLSKDNAMESNTEQNPENELPFYETGTKKGTDPSFGSVEYTFENFVVGKSNEFAHAACIAVSNNLAIKNNPLFIYGQSGLGKTHLLYAITNDLLKKNPGINIVYVKGEEFTNQLIDSIGKRNSVAFRDKYRKADVLLIDDIQFIAGKEATQEEFFHTFNTLYEEHKQIILTSDRPPREMKTLEERLRTRFEWGIIADIQPPDFELRIAIMKNKAKSFNIEVSNEVLSFLAENLKSNIRQIEGAIKTIAAHSFINAKPITIELAKKCISNMVVGGEPVNITVDRIINVVSKYYGIPSEEIKGKKRTNDIAMARNISIYIMREVTELSLPNIGKMMNRDHTTILSSYRSVENKIKKDPSFEIQVKELINEIKK